MATSYHKVYYKTSFFDKITWAYFFAHRQVCALWLMIFAGITKMMNFYAAECCLNLYGDAG